VDDVEASISFYNRLLGLAVSADVGWYVELGRTGRDEVALALVERGHPSVPAGFDTSRGGMLVSVLVSDASDLAAAARERGERFAQECRDEDFGQRHFMVVDPDGFLVDVIQRIPPSLAFRRALVEGRRRRQ
jgi:catechol 2,3-dioxygenase-like lactoylglutathione lyase family enzyme